MKTLGLVSFEIVKSFFWRLPLSLLICLAAFGLMLPAAAGCEVDITPLTRLLE